MEEQNKRTHGYRAHFWYTQQIRTWDSLKGG